MTWGFLSNTSLVNPHNIGSTGMTNPSLQTRKPSFRGFKWPARSYKISKRSKGRDIDN